MKTYNPNFNGWRAIGFNVNGDQHLFYMGNSVEQVKKNFSGFFYEILAPEEQTAIVRVSIERWVGSPNFGTWVFHENHKVPRVYKVVV